MDVRDLLQHGFRYAYSLTHSQHDAEDLVQDAWIRLSAKGRGNCSRSLIFTTIRNLFIDRCRRKNLVCFEPLDEIDEPVLFGDSHSSDLTLDEIGIAMQRLRHEEREALYLNIVEGYTANEIAKITQRSRNTVLSLIARGKKKLAGLLDEKKSVEVEKNDRTAECELS